MIVLTRLPDATIEVIVQPLSKIGRVNTGRRFARQEFFTNLSPTIRECPTSMLCHYLDLTEFNNFLQIRAPGTVAAPLFAATRMRLRSAGGLTKAGTRAMAIPGIDRLLSNSLEEPTRSSP
jgi:hypothetical protein